MANSPFLYPIGVYQVRGYSHDLCFHALEMYTLEVTESGILRWVRHHCHAIGYDKKYLQRRMYRLNKKLEVPTLQGIRHGYRLTKRQFDKLCKSGHIASTKIKRRGDYYVIS